MADDLHSSEPKDQNHATAGQVLLVFTLLFLVGVIHGVLAFGCYFINEFRRLSSLEIALLCIGDLIGLYWFLRFCFRWQFGRAEEFESLGSAASIPNPIWVLLEVGCSPIGKKSLSSIPKSVWLMLLSMAIGLGSELAMTLALRHEEYAGFQRAVPATCTLHRVQAQIAQGAATYWKLDGQYEDAKGVSHPVTYYVRDRDELGLLPGPLVLAIRQMQPNIPLPIVYDPKRPGRSWIPQLGWDDGNRLHYMSLLILFFQLLFSMMFLALLWSTVKDHGQLPNWAEYHGLIPLGCQAFIMALFGGLELYVVKRFCP